MKRVLLKLSGEALAGEKKTGFDEAVVTMVARQVKEVVDSGCEVGIVIGGGNFWRGRTSENIDRTKADQIGMLATVMNCIYVSEIFRSEGMMTNILTPFEIGSFTKLFSKDRANKYFSKGMVVFFAGGTGHPYFSTDTGVILRAVEVEADGVLLTGAPVLVFSLQAQKDSITDSMINKKGRSFFINSPPIMFIWLCVFLICRWGKEHKYREKLKSACQHIKAKHQLGYGGIKSEIACRACFSKSGANIVNGGCNRGKACYRVDPVDSGYKHRRNNKEHTVHYDKGNCSANNPLFNRFSVHFNRNNGAGMGNILYFSHSVFSKQHNS